MLPIPQYLSRRRTSWKSRRMLTSKEDVQKRAKTLFALHNITPSQHSHTKHTRHGTNFTTASWPRRQLNGRRTGDAHAARSYKTLREFQPAPHLQASEGKGGDAKGKVEGHCGGEGNGERAPPNFYAESDFQYAFRNQLTLRATKCG